MRGVGNFSCAAVCFGGRSSGPRGTGREVPPPRDAPPICKEKEIRDMKKRIVSILLALFMVLAIPPGRAEAAAIVSRMAEPDTAYPLR